MKCPKGHRKNPWSLKDIIPDDPEEVYDILVKNGMFRNRDPENLAKPISGSNTDMADIPGEISDYENGIQEWIKEAFLEER